MMSVSVGGVRVSRWGIYRQYKGGREVGDNLYGEEVGVGDRVDNMGNVRWEEIFRDGGVEELIEEGLGKNRDLE